MPAIIKYAPAVPPLNRLRRLATWIKTPALSHLGLASLLVAALGFSLYWVDIDYPIKHWLFIPYAQAALLAGFFILASLSVGHECLKWVGHRATSGLYAGERWLLALAVGVLIFAVGVFIAGILHVYGWVFFVLWPTLLLFVGARTTSLSIRRLYRHRRRLAFVIGPRTPLALAALLFTGFGILLVYSHVLTPENLGYDARWYHLPIAEHYVAAGGIRRFKEGWYLGAYPQLATWLYTWAFQLPRSSLFDRVALASHVEFALFLVTVAGVPLVVRRILNGRRAPASTAVFFLFPSIWLYDSNLITGADHILAFWACPIALALFAFAKAATSQRAVIVAMVVSGAVLTKFQALYLVAPVVPCVVWVLWREQAWKTAIVGVTSALALTTPYWLKNTIFYGDPVFPLLYQHLELRPFTPAAGPAIEEVFKTPNFIVQGTMSHRLWESVKAMFTFAFIPHDWESFKGNTPVFGFLFTLLSPAWIFLRDRKRAVLLILGTHLGVFCWYFTNHQDRYLQALIPWMAAVVGATIVRIWSAPLAARVCLSALVAFQIVWSGDIFFFKTHAMIGDAPVKHLADHLGAGHQRNFSDRFQHFSQTFRDVRGKTPPNAHILVHRNHEKLGLGRQTVVDGSGYQSAIDYLDLEHAGRAYQLLRQLDVTHLMFAPFDPGDDNKELAKEVVFRHMAAALAGSTQNVRDVTLVTLLEAADVNLATSIGILSCNSALVPGIYTATSLSLGQPVQDLGTHPISEIFGPATVVLQQSGCPLDDKAKHWVADHFAYSSQLGRFNLLMPKGAAL